MVAGSTAAWGMRLAWCALVGAALVVMGSGLERMFYIENTSEAVARGRTGVAMVVLASLGLLAAAGWLRAVGGPWWVVGAVTTPAVLCGGLAVLAPETVLPFLAALVAYPVALVGLVAGLLVSRR